MDAARRQMVTALSAIPGAIDTLSHLADLIREGRAPGAELVLLPDGGELQPGRVEPVLLAIARANRLRSCLTWTANGNGHDERSRARAVRAEHLIGRALVRQPIRPTIIEEIVAELSRRQRQLDDEATVPEVERCVGLPAAAFRERFARVAAAQRELYEANR